MSNMGRPELEVDWELAEKLAFIQCTAAEIADALKVSEATMLRRCKELYDCTFAEWIQQKGAGGRSSLRKMQFDTAKKGNVIMQIWLGKNWLGQKDKSEVTQNIDLGKTIIDVSNDDDDTI